MIGRQCWTSSMGNLVCQDIIREDLRREVEKIIILSVERVLGWMSGLIR